MSDGDMRYQLYKRTVEQQANRVLVEGRCCVVTGLGNSVTSTGGNFKLNSLCFDGEWPGVCIWDLKSLM